MFFEHNWIAFVLLIIPAVLDLSLALFLSISRKTPTSTIFACFSFAVGLWTLGLCLFGLVDLQKAYIWNKVFILSAAFIPATFLHFSFLFNEEYLDKKGIFSIYAPAGVITLLICVWPALFIKNLIQHDWGKESVLGVCYVPYALYFVLYTSYAAIKLFMRMLKVKGILRERYKFILIATLPAFTMGALFDLVLILLGNYRYVWAGPYFTCCFVLVTTYAIIRYRLMDIRVAISSATIFLAVYSLALGIPFFLYWKGYHFASLLSAIALATPAPIIYSHLKKQAEDQILHEERNYQHILTQASNTFADKLELADIVQSIMQIVGRTIRPSNRAFYLYDGEKFVLKDTYGNPSGYPNEFFIGDPLVEYLRNHGAFYIDEMRHKGGSESDQEEILPVLKSLEKCPASVVIPFRRVDSMPGILFLGPKPKNASYSDRDMVVLKDLAINVAMAMVTAINYANEKKTFEDRMHDERLKDIGILGSAVAHQMANRLNRITAELFVAQDMLNEEALQKDSREELVAKIKESFANYPLMIRDAMSSRAIADALKRSSKRGAEPRFVHLRELVQGGKALADVKHQNCKYEFIEEYDENIKLWVNDTVIQDVFSNSIDNSLDAITYKRRNPDCPPDYEAFIKVKAQVQDDMAVIELTDNGVGIKPENKDKMFIPLFTTKGTENGTGLGLHAMKSFVKGQGGDIQLASEYMQWTTVTISLPVVNKANTLPVK